MWVNARREALRALFILSGIALIPGEMMAQKSGGSAPARSAAPAPAPRAQAAQARPAARQNANQRQNLPNRQQNHPNRQNQNFGQNRPANHIAPRPDQSRIGNNGAGQRNFVTRLPGGGTREVRPGGALVERNANGGMTRINMPNRGITATMNPRTGRPSSISANDAGRRTMIQRGPMNERRVEQIRSVPGGVEHISHYGNWSSVQRPIVGRPGYVQRTVLVGGASYSTVYRSYPYHGIVLFSPVPAVVFAPSYYGWLMSPWAAPVVYPPAYWGWAGQPWYQAYGAAFTPYPVYNSPDQWLTDYVISSGLQQTYQGQQLASGELPPPINPISSEDKAALDEDVRNELARQRQFAAAQENNQTTAPSQDANSPNTARNMPEPEPPPPVPEALQDHVFTVFTAPVKATQSSGETCDLAMADMLYRTGAAPNPDNSVDVTVRTSHANASHPDYCPRQAQVKVQLSDLQEMYNHKKELIAEGEKKQATLAGNRLPKSPAPHPTQVARGQVDPDTAAAAADLEQMMKDANKTEGEVSVVATTQTN